MYIYHFDNPPSLSFSTKGCILILLTTPSPLFFQRRDVYYKYLYWRHRVKIHFVSISDSEFSYVPLRRPGRVWQVWPGFDPEPRGVSSLLRLLGFPGKYWVKAVLQKPLMCWKVIPRFSSKDMKKSLQPTYLTQIYKETSHTTWTQNIKMRDILLYYLYNKFKVHIVWLVFLEVRVIYFNWRYSIMSFVIL